MRKRYSTKLYIRHKITKEIMARCRHMDDAIDKFIMLQILANHEVVKECGLTPSAYVPLEIIKADVKKAYKVGQVTGRKKEAGIQEAVCAVWNIRLSEFVF